MGVLEPIDKFFKITERGSTFGTEIKAGVITFLTMSYILLVNPQILGQAGLPVKEVVTATALASLVSSLSVGLLANMPVGMSPGMGLNAFLVFSQVLGNTPYAGNAEAALAGCMIAAAFVAVLAIIQALALILAVVPNSIKLATVVGMGLLLSFIGCQTAKIVVPDAETMVTMGNLMQLECILAIFGLSLIAALHYRNVPGSIIIGILAVSLAYWFFNSSWPQSFVSLPHYKLMHLDYTWIFKTPDVSAYSAILAYSLVIIFDVGGAMFGLGNLAGLVQDGKVPHATLIYLSAAAGTAVGALTGTTPVIIAAESAVGIKEGGRTGLVAVTVSVCFFLSMFLAPFLQAIPQVANAPVLVLVGAMMMGESIHIDWSTMPTAVPAFLTIVIQPFTFSIANGIYAGLATSVLLFFFTGNFITYFRSQPTQAETSNDLEEPFLANGTEEGVEASGSSTNPISIASQKIITSLNNAPHFDLSSSFTMLVNTSGSARARLLSDANSDQQQQQAHPPQ